MYADQATEAIWDQLRETRWSPPAPAVTTAERRATYVFALEQAEQMFRAAATVGPATRPLLVFYGLSQAGRAIATAASGIGAGDAWKLTGHGISSVGLDRRLPEIEVRTGKLGDRGSFVRLSELLNSPVWGKESIRLNELWDLLPENQQSPLLDKGRMRRTPLWIEHRDLYSERHPLASVPVVGFPPWVIEAPNGRDALDDYLKSFSVAAQQYHDFLRLDQDPDGDPAFRRHKDGWGELYMHWRVPEGQKGTLVERRALLQAMTHPYKEKLYLFPFVTSDKRILHPLMTWWAVLHTLSMLARYQPAEWATHIDVDRSKNAVAIERLLKNAIGIIPRLVLEVLRQVAV